MLLSQAFSAQVPGFPDCVSRLCVQWEREETRSPDISRITCCDRGYGRPSWRPRVLAPATYRSGTPRNQHPAVARWYAHLRGLATPIREISGLMSVVAHNGELKSLLNYLHEIQNMHNYI